MLSYNLLNKVAHEYGDSFYMLDSKVIEQNYRELLEAFRRVYSKSHIAYSYKTNYIPRVCKLIDSLGGFAEIVSEMELWLANHVGVDASNIYYNGPYKKAEYIENALLSGVHINLDAEYEIEIVQEIAKKYSEHTFEVGLRCNVDIGQEVPSRFGFDVISGELQSAMGQIASMTNVRVVGLHCHIPFRTLDTYKKRVKAMTEILDMFPQQQLAYISMGGGYMGKIDDEMLDQFSFVPPTFEDYADVIAGFMAERYGNDENAPMLIIEPGSALVANAMKYVTRVLNIKKARENEVASLTGSTFQVNPSVKDMNRPLEIYHAIDDDAGYISYENLYMAGYTCIESDYLYKGYSGKLGVGDFVVFKNVGSYSVVMKPPFILPDIPILEINSEEDIVVCKKGQTAEDVFHLFSVE